MTFTLGSRAISAGYGLVAFDSIGSTNAEALSHARKGEPRPTWFVTSEQTAGRGRRQRAWVAPRGNLASSVLEALDTTPAAAATLGFAAALALEVALSRVSRRSAGAAGELEEIKFALKWPNDVLAGGEKLAGILLEAEAIPGDRLAVVAGIGTNVVAAPQGTPTPATSLLRLGIEISAEDLFAALSDSWVETYGIWDRGRGFHEIRRSWLAKATGLGQPVAVHTASADIAGTFETIDGTGCMIVRTSSGDRVPISAGDVYFGSAASAGTA
jgi:BirA family transcriptional regulator, biotin operon repressor / biotin---[acetyl-CoA-carboxylase] ligase